MWQQLSKLVPILQKFDAETVQLLIRFVQRASVQPDANGWIKDRLKVVLGDTKVVEVVDP